MAGSVNYVLIQTEQAAEGLRKGLLDPAYRPVLDPREVATLLPHLHYEAWLDDCEKLNSHYRAESEFGVQDYTEAGDLYMARVNVLLGEAEDFITAKYGTPTETRRVKLIAKWSHMAEQFGRLPGADQAGFVPLMKSERSRLWSKPFRNLMDGFFAIYTQKTEADRLKPFDVEMRGMTADWLAFSAAEQRKDAA